MKLQTHGSHGSAGERAELPLNDTETGIKIKYKMNKEGERAIKLTAEGKNTALCEDLSSLLRL